MDSDWTGSFQLHPFHTLGTEHTNLIGSMRLRFLIFFICVALFPISFGGSPSARFGLDHLQCAGSYNYFGHVLCNVLIGIKHFCLHSLSLLLPSSHPSCLLLTVPQCTQHTAPLRPRLFPEHLNRSAAGSVFGYRSQPSPVTW